MSEIKALVGAVGSGDNDVKMLKKATVAFSTFKNAHDEVKNAADIILEDDDLIQVAETMCHGREYKDHLMKFVMLQIPTSVSALALVLTQMFLYKEILVQALFVYLINLIYLPIGLMCIVREHSPERLQDMCTRWRANEAAIGTKTLTRYMRDEYITSSIAVVTFWQLAAMAGLYLKADYLFTLVHFDLQWGEKDPLFVDDKWLQEHETEAAADYQLNDLTDKGKMFLIIF